MFSYCCRISTPSQSNSTITEPSPSGNCVQTSTALEWATLLTHVFSPESTRFESISSIRVRIDPTSEPASGSEIPIAMLSSPARTGEGIALWRRQYRIIRSLAVRRASGCRGNSAVSGQTRPTASIVRMASSSVIPPPPYVFVEIDTEKASVGQESHVFPRRFAVPVECPTGEFAARNVFYRRDQHLLLGCERDHVVLYQGSRYQCPAPSRKDVSFYADSVSATFRVTSRQNSTDCSHTLSSDGENRVLIRSRVPQGQFLYAVFAILLLV